MANANDELLIYEGGLDAKIDNTKQRVWVKTGADRIVVDKKTDERLSDRLGIIDNLLGDVASEGEGAQSLITRINTVRDDVQSRGGVYVGPGAMPDNCNLQIDLESEFVVIPVVTDAYNPNSSNGMSGRAVATALAPLTDKINESLVGVAESAPSINRITDIGTVNETFVTAERKLLMLNMYGRSEQKGAPTELNPVDIESVADTKVITEYITGKNLIEDVTGTYLEQLNIRPGLPPGIYTISCILHSDDEDTEDCRMAINTDEAVEYVQFERGIKVSHTFEVKKKFNSITIYAAGTYADSAGDSITVRDCQVERGDTATDYVKGIVRKASVNLSGPLCSDANQDLCDVLTVNVDGTGTVTRYLAKENLRNVSDTLFRAGLAGDSIFCLAPRVTPKKNDDPTTLPAHIPLCSIANVHTISELSDEEVPNYGFAIWNWGGYIAFRLESIHSIDEAADFLDNNDIYVVYERETPLVEHLTVNQLAEFTQLYNIVPQSVAYNSDNALQYVRYGIDTQSYIDTQDQKIIDTVDELWHLSNANSSGVTAETDTGSILHVPGSLGKAICSYETTGSTSQATLTGRNILPRFSDFIATDSNVVESYNIIDDKDLSITVGANSGNYTHRVVATMNVGSNLRGKDVVLSVSGLEVTGDLQPTLSVFESPSLNTNTSREYVDINGDPTGVQVITWTMAEDTTVLQISFNAHIGPTNGGTVVFKDLMLELGTAYTNFEEYIGGVPSPSVYVPQEIIGVGNNKNLAVSMSNKPLDIIYESGRYDETSCGTKIAGSTYARISSPLKLSAGSNYLVHIPNNQRNLKVRYALYESLNANASFVSDYLIMPITIKPGSGTNYLTLDFTTDTSDTNLVALLMDAIVSTYESSYIKDVEPLQGLDFYKDKIVLPPDRQAYVERNFKFITIEGEEFKAATINTECEFGTAVTFVVPNVDFTISKCDSFTYAGTNADPSTSQLYSYSSSSDSTSSVTFIVPKTVTSQLAANIWFKEHAPKLLVRRVTPYKEELDLACVHDVYRLCVNNSNAYLFNEEFQPQKTSYVLETKAYIDKQFDGLKEYIDQKVAEANRYSDERLIEAKEYVDTKVVECKAYADDVVDILRQQILPRLEALDGIHVEGN